MPAVLAQIAIILGLILVALVAGNNLSVCVGSVIGSRVMKRRSGILLTIVAYTVGLVVQGGFLGHTVSLLLSQGNPLALDVALAIAIGVFVIAEVARVPQSLTVTLTAILVGVDVAVSGVAKLGFVDTIVAFWITMPLLSFVFVAVVMRWASTRLPKNNIWGNVKVMKLALIATSFFVAFTLGGNTIGLIARMMPASGISFMGIDATFIGIVAAIVVGCVLFSQGPLNRIGNEIIPMRYLNAVGAMFISAFLVEIATLVGVPLSNTDAFVASVYGAGVSYKRRLIRRRPFFTIVGLRILAGICGFIAGFVAVYAIAVL